jgi:hypothetical protein
MRDERIRRKRRVERAFWMVGRTAWRKSAELIRNLLTAECPDGQECLCSNSRKCAVLFDVFSTADLRVCIPPLEAKAMFSPVTGR